MKNYDSVSADLLGYCDDYIRDCATSEIKAPNEHIYNLSVEYMLGTTTTKHREQLVQFFLNR